MTRGALFNKLNKSDVGSKDRSSERWEYSPYRARIIPAHQQRLVCAYRESCSLHERSRIG
jgi:hypothetical protein